MPTTIDPSLFEDRHHSPSLSTVARSLQLTTGQLLDFCIPVNPYFPPPELIARLREHLDEALRFYPSYNQRLTPLLAEIVGLPAERLVLGNGSTELITWINRLFVADSLVIPVPTFSRWTADPLASGKRVHTLLRPEHADFNLDPAGFAAFVAHCGARVAVLCNPNNPTGALMPVGQVRELLERLAHLDLVVIDESFIDFASAEPPPSVAAEVHHHPNALVLKSLGKNFGLHGLRLGYAVGHPERIRPLAEALPFWNVNGVAERMLLELPSFLLHYELSRRLVVRDRIALEQRLQRLPGLHVYPSRANFLYVRLEAGSGFSGPELRDRLLSDAGILVRECGNKEGSSSNHFRIAVRPEAEAERLESALRHLLAG